VSAAVTAHYLLGAVLAANLPGLHARFGASAVTRAGVAALALGLVGWASAEAPWHLFVAAALTGCGWSTMAAAAINLIVSQWFVAGRPKALSMAYNGGSIGGMVFSPLWVLLIDAMGFQAAVALVGGVAVVVVWWLAAAVFSRSPASMGQFPDGVAPSPGAGGAVGAAVAALPGGLLWRNWQFRTLAVGMALGLFAQIGLLSHLFSLIVPALGGGTAGVVMGLATASAIAGRTVFGWLMPAGADRRRMAALSYAVQIGGGAFLILSGLQEPAMMVLGILLFGFGIGNATSVPPLIAQVEFAREDSGRAVALIVAIGQATYAFAPAAFGMLRDGDVTGGSVAVFLAAIGFQGLAIAAFLLGRR
jgi:MFS family permease